MEVSSFEALSPRGQAARLRRLALEAAELLMATGVDMEVVDVQTLLPFDGESRIVDSVKKTNRVVFVDEDVPGGATAYMLQKVLVEQNAYHALRLADRGYVMVNGRIALSGSGAELLANEEVRAAYLEGG